MPLDKAHRSPLNDLTKIRKQAIIDFIREFRAKNDNMSPTIRQITVAIGYQPQSFGTVHTLVNSLIAEGWLVKAGEGAKTLKLADPLPADYYYRREDAIREMKRELKKT